MKDRERGRSSNRLQNLLGALLLAAYYLASSLANFGFGRADNGDFGHLAGHWISKPQGFAVSWPAADDPAWSRRFFRCWLRYWERQPDPAAAPPTPSDLSSTRFFWLAAFGLDRSFSSPEVFDLLWLGAVLRTGSLALLLLLYAIAAAHFRGRPGCLSWVPLLVTAPLAASFADPRLTTFYNTFYREAGSALYALLAVCGLLALSGRRFWGPAALATAGAALLAESASAHFPSALLAAATLAFAFLCRWRTDGPPRLAGWLGIAAAVALLLAAGLDSERRTDRILRKNNAFHTLLLGALQASDDPERHLAALGLPLEARRLIGSTAFGPEAQTFIQENWNRFGHRAAARVLLREPVLIPRMLRRSAASMNDPETALEMVSNEACTEHTPRLAWWTRLKGTLLPGGYPLLVLLLVAALAGLAATFRPDPRVFAVGLTLAFASLCALAEMASAVFGDGFFDLARHLLTGSVFVDIVLALLIWLCALALSRPST